jgi:hypothetical protein
VAASGESPDTSTQALEAKLTDARANLAIAEAAGDAALINTPAGVSAQDFANRRTLLQRLVRLFEQQLPRLRHTRSS